MKLDKSCALFFATKIDNFSGDLASLSVEENDLLTASDSQYVAPVVRF